MRTVRGIKRLEGLPVLVRAALNVPIVDGKVSGSFRLRRALPTIEYLRERHAKVILLGHIGDRGTESLQPVYETMKTMVPGLKFCPVTTGPVARAAVRALAPGEVLMLENVRRDVGEKKNTKAFAAALADLADVFVQDSFDVCHRPHASVVGVPEFLPSYAGLLVEEEVRELKKALKPKNPSLAVIGGAKFATKQPVLKKLLAVYERVYVGGALANDFAVAEGLPVGKSLVGGASKAEIRVLLGNRRLSLPLDYVVAPHGGKREQGRVATVRDVKDSEAILDNGPKTIAMLAERVEKAKTIVWNGPLGNYENGFTTATEDLARLIANSRAHSIVGGGDTVAAIEKVGVSGKFSFISTGGGAMLDFLSKGTLPGIEALR
ncbi:phosphoglycerate kinase [Patescibacteria group bacterium]|nr:phosphoglycerate kinase [Patescibacteria group bacterium]MBU1500422.1 phosphoglycerate kinase [Patescibacteria group bacterium]MBU2080490.1 phosphoglycerate kinase [Patescibacteria group bacterium]MBU2123705.1 phosphoglycerate kinase [Patescibacteria group bacterium]MBU2194561.1 phosphoglycerate kinase [Patescibacteria group bacterium]